MSQPQVFNSRSDLTDTIVNRNDQQVTSARPVPSTRAVNAYGISVLKGGNILGTPFFQSVCDAYSNAFSYQPLATLLLLVSLFYFLSRLSDLPYLSPFVSAQTALVLSASDATIPIAVRSISYFAHIIVSFLVSYEYLFATAFAFFFPYFSKPSNRNLTVAAGFTLLAVLLSYKPISIIALSQLFFLYVQLRNPTHKAFILGLAVITVIVGHEFMAKLSGVKNFDTVPSPGKPTPASAIPAKTK